jgi:hypothetical protein
VLRDVEVTVDWRKLPNELRNLYSSPYINRKMRWTGLVARKEEIINMKCLKDYVTIRLRAGRQRGRFSIPGRCKRCLFFITPRLALRTHPASYTMGTGNSILGPKRQESEADHSLPPTAKVKNDGVIPLLPHTPSRRGA